MVKRISEKADALDEALSVGDYIEAEAIGCELVELLNDALLKSVTVSINGHELTRLPAGWCSDTANGLTADMAASYLIGCKAINKDEAAAVTSALQALELLEVCSDD